MITPLSIISLDQGKIWRDPPDEDQHAAIPQPAAPNRAWLWSRLIRPWAARYRLQVISSPATAARR
jgi:hypothetical protein